MGDRVDALALGLWRVADADGEPEEEQDGRGANHRQRDGDQDGDDLRKSQVKNCVGEQASSIGCVDVELSSHEPANRAERHRRRGRRWRRPG